MTMNRQTSEQAIMNGIYAAAAWLLFDIGNLFQAHGDQTFAVLSSHPEMAIGAAIVVCIIGLFYKSRLAAFVLLLLFLIPMILRAIQGAFPSAMVLLFSLILLYFFLTAVLGTFAYRQAERAETEAGTPD